MKRKYISENPNKYRKFTGGDLVAIDENQDSDPDKKDYVYWSGSFSNPNDTIAPVIIDDKRGSALIIKPRNYEMYVQNITLDTTNTPFFIAQCLQQSDGFFPTTTNYFGSNVTSWTSSTFYSPTGNEIGNWYLINTSCQIEGVRTLFTAGLASFTAINIWNVVGTTGTLLQSVTFTSPTVTGWYEYKCTPFIVNVGQTIAISVYAGSGNYYKTNFTPATTSDGYVTGIKGCYGAGSGTFPATAYTTSPVSSFPVDFVYGDSPVIPTVDTLNYWVSLLWNDTYSSVYLIMNSFNPTFKPPTVDPNNSINYPLYYGIYNYEQFMRMINTALASAYTLLQAQTNYPTSDVSPPYVVLNADSGCLALVVPYTMKTNNVSMMFENSLQQKLNIPCTYIVYNQPILPFPNSAYQLNFNSQYYVQSSANFLTANANTSFDTSVGLYGTRSPQWNYPAFYLCTDHDYRAAWIDVYQLIVTSNLATQENVGDPLTSNTVNTFTQPILASYTFDLQGSQILGNQITYSPFIKNWITLAPSDSVMNIRIEFWYSDRIGNLYRVTQGKDKIAKIRLVFRKKK